MSPTPNEPAREHLAAYLRFWAANRFWSLCLYPSAPELALALLSGFAALRPPERWSLALLAHAGYVFWQCCELPFIFTSDAWCALLDVGVIASSLRFMACRREVDDCSPRARRNAMAAEIGATATVQLGILYFACGVWKLNTGHLNPRTSCATILFVQLLSAWLPEALLSPWLLELVGWAAGPSTIAIECALGLLLLFAPSRRRTTQLAVLLGLALHTLIALVPPPNNAGIFGMKLMPRYVFLLPHATATVSDAACRAPDTTTRVLTASTVAGVLGAATALGRQIGGGELGATVSADWAVPMFTAQALLLGSALWKDLQDYRLGPKASGSATHLARWDLVRAGVAGLTLIYAFVPLLLGTGDIGTVAGPFSNLRTHGSSNHLLFPTGLLHSDDAAGSSAFGSGIVRIDGTNSSFIDAIFPNEVSGGFSPQLRLQLQTAGHSGREWMPLISRLLGAYDGFSDSQHESNFTRYTVPAFELRRLVMEAPPGYWLEYTKLPVQDGPWDSQNSLLASAKVGSSSVVPAAVRFEVSVNGARHCQVGENAVCEPNEVVLLPPPSWLALKFALFYPQPLLPHDSPDSVCCT